MTEPTWAGFTYATPRDPTRRTRGGKIAELARRLGWEPMPWQQQVWDVATEIDDDGNYIYEKVMITVPRQSGKTTLFGPVQIYRALERPRSQIYFTAQTGDDARTLMKKLITDVETSPLSRWASGKRSAAQTGIVWPNRSEIWAFPPLSAKIHGKTPVLVGIDEIWVLDAIKGKDLVADGIEPAQSTLKGRRQIWFFSTAGTAESVYMKGLVKNGRRSVTEPGSAPKFAYFEASLPDDADPYDREAFARFHPAVGFTQDVDDLFAKVDGRAPEEERVDHATWVRAYCNRWAETANPFIADADWKAMGNSTIGARRSEIAISWDVALDGEMGAVLATWRSGAGTPHTRVLHAAPVTGWMVDLLVELYSWNPIAFGADDSGPTRRITDEVRRRLNELHGDDPDRVTTLNGVQRGIADEAWITAVRDERTLIQDGSETLAFGVSHIVVKRVGDVTRISRSESSGPVAAPIASSVGLYLYDHRAAPEWAPVTNYMEGR